MANAVATAICDAQGPAGQWWWHYDSRTGGVVEGYPVYTVHQHAMAPMALLDLADAGGDAHLAEICRGLRWLAARAGDPADSPASMQLVLEDPPITWRKIARADHRKLVRGVRAASTRLHPRTRLRGPGPDVPAGTRRLRMPALRAGLAAADLAVLSSRGGPMSDDAAGWTRRNLFGLSIDAVTMSQAVARCREAIDHASSCPSAWSTRPRSFRCGRTRSCGQAVAGSDMILADGQAVVWASRLLGQPLPERVAGIDLFTELLAEAERNGDRVYFLAPVPRCWPRW